jgi:hypothetical protein
MRLWRHTLYRIATICAVVTSAACASVPKEVVELSYRMGQDLEVVHSSYVTLIHQHFDSLKQARIDYVDNEWAPVFLKDFIARGRLVDMAKGTIVMTGGKFAAPDGGRQESQLLDSVGAWARAATARIDRKKADLVDPLNAQETSLTADVNNAFDQLSRGNATITAHLNSLRKVQEVQDQALEALNLKNLRDTINARLVQASDLAAKGLDDVRKADKVVKQADAFIEQ